MANLDFASSVIGRFLPLCCYIFMLTQATLSEFIITLNNDLYKIHAKVGMCGHNGTKPSDMQ